MVSEETRASEDSQGPLDYQAHQVVLVLQAWMEHKVVQGLQVRMEIRVSLVCQELEAQGLDITSQGQRQYDTV